MTEVEDSQREPTAGACPEATEDGEIVEAPRDVVERSIEAAQHPLEHAWTFWFDNPSGKNRQATWGSSIRAIHTFSSVEEFWWYAPFSLTYKRTQTRLLLSGCLTMFRVWMHNLVFKLVAGADFHCFKYKIEPKWEDPVCANGGKWTISCARGKADKWWLYTLLAMIGEQFIHGDEICGAVVNVRSKQEKISIWTKNAANEVAQVSIGKQWKEFLDYNETIGFIVHDDAMKMDRAAKNRYTV